MSGLESYFTSGVISALLDQTHAMIALLGADCDILDGNQAFKTHQRHFPDTHSLFDLLPTSEHHVFRKWATETHRTNLPIHEAVLLLTSDQREVCFDALLIPLPEQKLIFIAEDITSDPDLTAVVQRLSRQVKLFKVESTHAKQIAINKQIELEAVMTQADEIQHIDPLTFLPNRRLIMNALQSEVSRARRYNTPFSISMLDVDHFKSINDTYGHQVGDKVLEQIAHHLRDHIRHPDSAGRYGGEEFLILLPSTPITPAAEQAARLCKQIRVLNITAGEHVLHLTVSIGTAELRSGTETWQELLSRADKAMYQAKEQGRDRWVAVEN